MKHSELYPCNDQGKCTTNVLLAKEKMNEDK